MCRSTLSVVRPWFVGRILLWFPAATLLNFIHCLKRLAYMGPNLTYWVVAWTLMALAFAAATGAILLGAIRLDRASADRNSENRNHPN